MSKIKLLIHEVFKQGEIDSRRNKKNGIAVFLSVYLKETLKLSIDERTLVRYYDAFIAETIKEMNIEPYKLDIFSKYIGYEDFSDFSRTFVKKDEMANKTTVKIKVDEDEQSLSDKFSNLNINITNEQHFKMPEFLKQNGLGIMEIALLICLVTGNVVFSNNKKMTNTSSFPLGFMSGIQSGIEKKYMYWNGEKYIATDSSYIRPGLDVVAMNEHQFLHFKKIMRKDTLTDVNALGRTWYSKYNNEVEFFTDDGIDPDNGRELRKSTSLIIYKYAGKQKDSVEIEE
ncbi:hypothetical protein JET18_11605 [Chryseobacterium sp. L7]|uniref:HTH araC/xylS-type domain-containing protein n=1 Tax=Chryseobacterium endalhagicum TaxID=2797638 RepID=A0ABS1QFW4_9FLAO|nr:hypothetical protein [Chryseobacterium endalhagicum]MBL1221490.1 hypothetical protein [Chryseobacterium endalhagicum]